MADALPSKIVFELVSPERLVVSRPVDMVVVPGSEGALGVLPGHAPLIALLRAGTIDIHENGQVTERIFVTGGFVEVTPERCVVLGEGAVPLAELDRAAVEAEVAELKRQTGGQIPSPDAPDQPAPVAALLVAEAKLQALAA